MKKYIVYGIMSQVLQTEIEADSEAEAWQIAKTMDGGSFYKIDGGTEWHIDNIKEVTA
jgi:hypothetical protein